MACASFSSSSRPRDVPDREPRHALILLAPALTWLVLFLVLPFLAIIVFSVGERAPEGGYQAAFTVDAIR